jgi:hypothetical protein
VAQVKEAALFIGWGSTYPGREHEAVKTFSMFIEALTELRTRGEIERFEPVMLSPHGGELDGFVLVYGDREKLALLPEREEMHKLQLRARYEHAKLSVIPAITGDRVGRELEQIDELVTLLAREPAAV